MRQGRWMFAGWALWAGVAVVTAIYVLSADSRLEGLQAEIQAGIDAARFEAEQARTKAEQSARLARKEKEDLVTALSLSMAEGKSSRQAMADLSTYRELMVDPAVSRARLDSVLAHNAERILATRIQFAEPRLSERRAMESQRAVWSTSLLLIGLVALTVYSASRRANDRPDTAPHVDAA